MPKVGLRRTFSARQFFAGRKDIGQVGNHGCATYLDLPLGCTPALPEPCKFPHDQQSQYGADLRLF
jgi:hypothetical protein